MNQWDIESAAGRYVDHPVLGRATRVLRRLMELANDCSDGWCYWPKPARAARKLMEFVEAGPAAATEGGLKAALGPVRAFLSRNARELGGRTISFD